MPIIPTIIEKSRQGRGERATDIFSRLLEERIIFLAGPITDDLSNLVVAEILLLASKDSTRDIKLYINTPGGSVTAGLAIYDTMSYVACDVSTICVGIAASMGALILSSGKKGKRFSLPNSEVMLHQVMGGTEGQASDIAINAKHILRTKDTLNKILAQNTGKKFEQVEKDSDRDYWMTSDEAKKYGIVDEIISKPKSGK